MVQTLAVAAIALCAEASVGYPDRLFRLVGHPVTWIGALIGALDRRLNRAILPERRRRLNGLLALALIAGLPTGCAALLQAATLALLPLPAALGLLGLLAATLPAQRSLARHVGAVERALSHGGPEGDGDRLTAGRRAVAMIVGRETGALDESGVVGAAIESLAENFSDGVVAPLLWCALFGLPGIVFYKAVNTADSMIGHLTPRHAAFGQASARLDDLVNLPASRLAALWLWLAAPRRSRAILAALRRDAPRHRSPNAGWPEAAMAAALGIRLGGPRLYHGVPADCAWIGDGRATLRPGDLRAALRCYCAACLIQAACLAAALCVPALGRGA